MKKLLSLLTLSLLISAPAFAGAGNAELQCRSKTGLTIEGNVPGDTAEFELNVANHGKSSHLYSTLNQTTVQVEENATISVVDSLEEGVWTLVSDLKDTFGEVKMYAVPRTLKMKKTTYGYNARFTAKGTVNLPELGGQTIETVLDCSLVYSL